jgi:hypothetical protein
MWMNFIVPSHLHGEIKGFSSENSSERQILQMGSPELDYDSTFSIFFLDFDVFFLKSIF